MLDTDNKIIINEVLDYFKAIAAIPRPSLHEKSVSDYLCKTFRDLGCEVIQDASYNIIANRTSSPGFEAAPLVILQAHMDMVCVAADGVDYNPLLDPIRLHRTDGYLSAKGTSLGADNGAGIAMILYVFRHIRQCGPLRAIITVDEETGMTGARNLDKKYLSDAKYLINWDSENCDELVRGSAGSVEIDFRKKIEWISPPKDGIAWKIAVQGLLGGHSGECIGMGRGNALRILARVLYGLKKAGLEFSTASMTGGSARNAIASEAKAVIVTHATQQDFEPLLSDIEYHIKKERTEEEQCFSIALSKTNPVEHVMGIETAAAIPDALMLLHSGIFQMSKAFPGLVETSANLGILRTDEEDVWFSYFARSSVDEKLSEIVDSCRVLGARCGLETHVGVPSPGWKERSKSELSDMMEAIFEMQNGRTMKVNVIHAGLECGWHNQKAPHLDIVSIGATTFDIHSPNEKLDLSTIAPQIRLVTEVLHRLAGKK